MTKRLLALAVVSLFMLPALMAQTFEFRYHGEPLADEATVTIAAAIDDFEEMSCGTNPYDNPTNGLILKLLSGSQNSGTATMTINENTLNPSRVLWCMGGNCMNFGSNTSITKTFTVNDGLCLVQFDAEDIQSEGHLLATLTATIGDETHTVKIKFTNGEQVIVGDVDGDGHISSGDITALYNYLLNGDDSNLVNGDVDGDGHITSGDVTAVYNIMLGN